MRTLFLSLILAAGLMAQSVVNGDRSFLGRVDASTATSTAPIKSGTSLPATCVSGKDVYFKTDATAGQNLHYCTATNTWTQQLAGGSSLGFVYSSGPSAGTAGSITNTGPPMGQVSTMQSAANWFRVAARVPAACTAKNLYVRLGVAQAGGASLVVTLYTGATTPTATTLTCTIASGSQDCSDVANTASIAAGDLIYLAYANASATAFTYANTSFQCN